MYSKNVLVSYTLTLNILFKSFVVWLCLGGYDSLVHDVVRLLSTWSLRG